MTIKPYQGKLPHLGKDVYIDDSAVAIGDVVLGDDVSVWPTAVLRGDVQGIRVGARVNVQDGAVLHVTHDGEFTPGGFALTIGVDVTIGHRAVLHGCRVGDLCLIGAGAMVLDGAVIEDQVMLGAGALAPPGKVLASGYLYVGAPARQARPLSEREKAFLAYSAAHYVALKNQYLVDRAGD